MRRLIVMVCLILALSACAGRRGPQPLVVLPELRIAPQTLGRTLALQQHLTFSFGNQHKEMDALLEADEHELRLAVQAMGQTGVRLIWDGHSLQVTRARWLPPEVRGERVLDDLQFALWPVDAIRAVLPSGWTLVEREGERMLELEGKPWLVLTQTGDGRMQLHNFAEGYVLEIQSRSLGDDTQ